MLKNHLVPYVNNSHVKNIVPGQIENDFERSFIVIAATPHIVRTNIVLIAQNCCISAVDRFNQKTIAARPDDRAKAL